MILRLDKKYESAQGDVQRAIAITSRKVPVHYLLTRASLWDLLKLPKSAKFDYDRIAAEYPDSRASIPRKYRSAN